MSASSLPRARVRFVRNGTEQTITGKLSELIGQFRFVWLSDEFTLSPVMYTSDDISVVYDGNRVVLYRIPVSHLVSVSYL